ncbi:thymidylate synthase [Candidatus Falkowbacteria bacterium]|nr:thymidylate synthase [Candidatus Falkowbacteria bacterium]
MNLAFLTSKRSSCKFHETGAVFVDKNKRIISIGYNGSTAGDLHCLEKGCAKVDGDPISGQLKRCRGAHAEINAIINVQDSTRLREATLYTVVFPCYDCMKALNNAGIKEIVYNEIYTRIQTGGEKTEEENEAWELARQQGIVVRQYSGENFYEEKMNRINLSVDMEKTVQPTSHRIGVTGFIYNQDKVLIVKRSDTESFLPGFYELVGGKIEMNETLEKGLEREIFEETNLTVQITKPFSAFGYSTEQANTVDVQYICIPTSPVDNLTLSEAHKDYKWMTEDEIDNYQISDEMKKVIRQGFETVKLNSLTTQSSEQAKDEHPERQYLNLLQDILDNGTRQEDKGTGAVTHSVFGRQLRFDLAKGFPLLTTKKVYWKGVLYELYWFLSGQSNIKYLVDNNVHIWDDYPYKIYREKMEAGRVPNLTKEQFIENIKTDTEFAKSYGNLKNVYGDMWRHWPAKDGRGIDQVAWLIKELREDPDCHNALVNSWNPEYLYSMAKPEEASRFPICHNMYQCNVKNGKLSLHLYQRSADIFLGVPFNIASYALLTYIFAKITGNEPGEFVHTFGDVHIYDNHIDQVKEQLSRQPKPLPSLRIDDSVKEVNDFLPKHAILEGYDAHETIKAELSPTGGLATKSWKSFLTKQN